MYGSGSASLQKADLSLACRERPLSAHTTVFKDSRLVHTKLRTWFGHNQSMFKKASAWKLETRCR